MKAFCLLAILFLATPGFAQDPMAIARDNENLARAGIYCIQTSSNTYFVKMATISSINMHDYIVDGAALVTELTISTSSSEVVRFYCLEPIIPQSPIGVGQSVIDKATEKVNEAIERTGQGETLRKVVKNYPLTTHAHTVEYRLQNKDQLNKIYGAILWRWVCGQGPFYYKVP